MAATNGTSPSKPVASRPLRRLLGYCCGAVLLLSLPTFSDWSPVIQVLPVSGQQAGSTFSQTRTPTRPSILASASAPHVPGGRAAAPGFVAGRRSNPLPSGGIASAPVSSSGPLAADPTRAPEESGPSSPSPRVRSATGASVAPEPAAVLDELSLMESELQSVYTQLFTGGGGGLANNPFQQALDDKQGQTGDRGASGSTGGTGTGNGSDSGSNGGEGDASGGGGTNPPPPPDNPPSDDSSAGVQFSFVVVGFEDQTLPRSARRLLHRAYRSSGAAVVLENGLQLNLLPGVVGPGREILVVQRNEQITTLIAQDRSRLRYFLARPSPLGTVLEERAGAATSRPVEALTVFYYKVLRSLATFDVDAAGSELLIATFYNSPTLVVLRVNADRTLEYQRELALPFSAAFAVGSRSRLVPNQGYVHVFDEGMRRSVAFSTQHPGSYSLSKPPSYVRGEEVVVDTAEGPIRYELLVYDTGLALWEESASSGLRFLGSFNTELGVPTILVGDYLANGSRQLLLVP
jgi:hypothetical protein